MLESAAAAMHIKQPSAIPLRLAGASALSAFRARRLGAEARARGIAIDRVQARNLFLVDCARELTDAERALVEELLARDGEAPAERDAVLVLPRPGTISPWSSKATDIVRNCRLAAVRRVERAVQWSISADPPLEAAALHPGLADLVHDRMTQVIAPGDDDASTLFAVTQPMPLRRIGLADGGIEALSAANQALGLALSDTEIAYLAESFGALGRDRLVVATVKDQGRHAHLGVGRMPCRVLDQPIVDHRVFAVAKVHRRHLALAAPARGDLEA